MIFLGKVLELDDIKKKFGSVHVLAGTSFYLNQGELVCLLGPSGSGKTTLFKMAAGLIEPDSGYVYKNSALRDGLVFQEPRLLPWKTAAANIDFIQQNYFPASKAKKVREKLLELTGLKNFKNSYPAQLSGGMKQRLEIIKALSIQPELLLLDEPFKSIDTQTKMNFQQMILRFWEESKLSILLITHDPKEAVLMADRIYILSRKPAEIIREFKIDRPQHQRTLRDNDLYEIREEIINIFVDLVDELNWEKGESSRNFVKEIYWE